MVLPSGPDAERYGEPSESTDERSESTEAVSRRSCLKAAGAAVLGVCGLGFANTASAAESDAADYQTITLAAGETREVTLGDGETFENALVDQRADGATFSIEAGGDGWAIRNVGFRGSGARTEFDFHARVSCPGGGRGVIENVYANNKHDPNEPMGMVLERAGNAGHVAMRHTYVEGFGNNAGYGTNANKLSGSGGTIAYEKCYHVDNAPANFRPGGDGSLVENCVSVVDDPEHDRADYTDGSSNVARATWPSHTRDIRLENVHFYTNPDDVNPGAFFDLRHDSISNDSVCAVEAVDCAGNLGEGHSLFESHDGNTDLTVENYQQGQQTVTVLGEGVPLSPEMAARGERALPQELPG